MTESVFIQLTTKAIPEFLMQLANRGNGDAQQEVASIRQVAEEQRLIAEKRAGQLIDMGYKPVLQQQIETSRGIELYILFHKPEQQGSVIGE